MTKQLHFADVLPVSVVPRICALNARQLVEVTQEKCRQLTRGVPHAYHPIEAVLGQLWELVKHDGGAPCK